MSQEQIFRRIVRNNLFSSPSFSPAVAVKSVSAALKGVYAKSCRNELAALAIPSATISSLSFVKLSPANRAERFYIVPRNRCFFRIFSHFRKIL